MTSRDAYVYLLDGRHLENLGFYEMILRRCHRVILIGDGGMEEVPSFRELEKSISRVQIEL